jgi:hypothetical protein
MRFKKTLTTLLSAVMIISLTALLPVNATAGLFGKITNAVAYPFKKVATDTSLDTHRAIQHNSIQPKHGNYGGGRQAVVKPDGHETPIYQQ